MQKIQCFVFFVDKPEEDCCSSHGVSSVSDCSKDSEQSTVAEESCAQWIDYLFHIYAIIFHLGVSHGLFVDVCFSLWRYDTSSWNSWTNRTQLGRLRCFRLQLEMVLWESIVLMLRPIWAFTTLNFELLRSYEAAHLTHTKGADFRQAIDRKKRPFFAQMQLSPKDQEPKVAQWQLDLWAGIAATNITSHFVSAFACCTPNDWFPDFISASHHVVQFPKILRTPRPPSTPGEALTPGSASFETSRRCRTKRAKCTQQKTTAPRVAVLDSEVVWYVWLFWCCDAAYIHCIIRDVIFVNHNFMCRKGWPETTRPDRGWAENWPWVNRVEGNTMCEYVRANAAEA